MPKGYVGESKSEQAINRMAKWLEKSEREKERSPQKKKDNSLLAQLKENFPNTWRDELYEMEIEFKNPGYVIEKEDAIKRAHLEYDKLPGLERKMGLSREEFVTQYMRKWKDDAQPKYKK